VAVSIRVADVEKTIVVYGPRVYCKSAFESPSTGPSADFAVRPIRYEDAYGGTDLEPPDHRRKRMDARNPVGKGVASDPSQLANQPAHTIEYPSGEAASRGPAGFGPLASFWSPRRERGGTYDEKWERLKRPLLPDDYDEKFHLCAPDDQRPSRPLHGDEPVQLVNLTPEGSLRFQLPKTFLTFSTFFGSRREEHRSRLGTILIEPDARKLKLVWHTSLSVRGEDVDYLDRTVIAEKGYVK
jgi:hypothetical protein